MIVHTKKAQQALINWFIALVLIFAIALGYFAVTKPFQYIDHQLSPQINITTDTQDGQEVVNKIRRYWVVWPIILIGSIILWAFFSSIKQDPNYPVY